MTTTVTVSFGSVTFTGVQIKAARMVEEIDPIAVELPINTLELTLFSADGDFSIINPSGFYANLKYKQPLDVYVNFGAGNVYMGKFYLDAWESISANVATFRAIDAIGILDKTQYVGIVITVGTFLVSTLLDEVLVNTSIIYELDASYSGTYIQGYIPPGSCREALQLIAFRLGAFITCSRSDKVRIVPMELANGLSAYDQTITAAQKGLGQPLALLPLVTGVEISSHKYNVNSETIELFNETLEIGAHRILFENPVSSLSLSGTATFTYDDVGNGIDVTVTVAGTVIVTQTGGWTDAIKKHSVYGSPPAGTNPNVINITDATTVHRAIGDGAAQRIYDYHQQRYLQKARFFALQIAPGNSVLISSQGGWIGGIIERMETDLARGFISQAEIVGVVASTCANILTANLTVTTGNNQTYIDCLDMFDFNADLQGSANLIIN